jgi:hypothetical protein
MLRSLHGWWVRDFGQERWITRVARNERGGADAIELPQDLETTAAAGGANGRGGRRSESGQRGNRAMGRHQRAPGAAKGCDDGPEPHGADSGDLAQRQVGG